MALTLSTFRSNLAIAAIVAGITLLAWNAPAQDAVGTAQPPPSGPPMEQRGVDVEEEVGHPLPLELSFTDSHGKVVSLGDYFKSDHRPAIIVLGYYRCPVVCGTIREKLAQSLVNVDYTLGKDYRVLNFSFDPGESPDSAEKARQFDLAFFSNSDDKTVDAGMAYHVSDATSARRLADAMGYKYKQLGNGEYSHPVVIALITPDGTISRYLYGFGQEPATLKLALMEASEGKLVRTVGERLMAFCYMYDPKRGSYTLQAFRVMQIGGVISLMAIGSLVGVLLIGERMKRKQKLRSAVAATAAGVPPGAVGVG